jgi:hypothetical protein
MRICCNFTTQYTCNHMYSTDYIEKTSLGYVVTVVDKQHLQFLFCCYLQTLQVSFITTNAVKSSFWSLTCTTYLNVGQCFCFVEVGSTSKSILLVSFFNKAFYQRSNFNLLTESVQIFRAKLRVARFINQKSQFGKNLEGLGMKKVVLFFGHLHRI